MRTQGPKPQGNLKEKSGPQASTDDEAALAADLSVSNLQAKPLPYPITLTTYLAMSIEQRAMSNK